MPQVNAFIRSTYTVFLSNIILYPPSALLFLLYYGPENPST
ncbi:hypothetical protein [Aeromonas phage Akh-2]|nr:hypothetical protein [Aeromonas phage Akh-2]